YKLLFFFFSSRRRHTRSKRDWSSDVCSSDLETAPKRTPVRILARRRDGSEFPVAIHRSPLGPSKNALSLVTVHDLTAWRDVQESLFRQKEQAVVTLASIADAVITTDVAGRIT